MEIELENGSIIKPINTSDKNTRSKRGNEQLNKMLDYDIDELYCYKWYKNMYIREGFNDEEASTRAKIDLNYQKSLYAMCELFGVEEDETNV